MCGSFAFRLPALVGLVVALAVSSVVEAAPATQPASTQPVLAGRGTPDGAMNVYEEALISGDVATVADSYNLPDDFRLIFTEEEIASVQFYVALNKKFDPDTADYVCKECRIRVPDLSRVYVADDWQYPPNQPGFAFGKAGEHGYTEMMQQGLDGIWRFGRIRPMRVGPRGAFVDPRITEATTLTAKLRKVTPDLVGGKFSTRDDVIQAIYPEGSPMARMRAMEEEQKKQNEAAEQKLMTTKFDPTTLGGAVGAFIQARNKMDAAAMAKFFYAENDPDAKLAHANAERIASAFQLEKAIGDHIDMQESGVLTEEFQLMSRDADTPEWLGDVRMNGNQAVGTFGGASKTVMNFRVVDGVWRYDITPKPPATSAGYADQLTQENQAVERAIAGIISKKYTSISQVRDALRAVWPQSVQTKLPVP
jgi:hypothetical protein